MTEGAILFIDANTLAAPVTRTILITGAGVEGLSWTWSAHVEEEADRHTRGGAMQTSTVRRSILKSDLSPTAAMTGGLRTLPKDRQVVADAISAGARYLITTDVDDFDLEDLSKHEMSAVNPDYFMALRFSEQAYHEAVEVLARVQRNPSRTPAEVHRMLGRRHPLLTARFAHAYDTTPVEADPDQPAVVFRGVACVRCSSHLDDKESSRVGLCAAHLPTT